MTLLLTEGPLAPLRDRPLTGAVRAAEAAKPGYRDHPVDLSDPRAADRLVDVRDHGIAGANAYHEGVAPYHQRFDGAVPDLLLRADLSQRLQAVNDRLAPYALSLWVFDAWRPVALQNHFHDRWLPDRLRAAHPDWTDAQVMAETGRYFAAGAPGGRINPASPPPHATGAAVDLTIRHRTGGDLFMGGIFDDLSAVSNTAHYEAAPDGLAFSHHEARANRRLLFWLMREAGFHNNPTEWWHFSRGDQMWARIEGAPAAFHSVPPDAPAQVAGR